MTKLPKVKWKKITPSAYREMRPDASDSALALGYSLLATGTDPLEHNPIMDDLTFIGVDMASAPEQQNKDVESSEKDA